MEKVIAHCLYLCEKEDWMTFPCVYASLGKQKSFWAQLCWQGQLAICTYIIGMMLGGIFRELYPKHNFHNLCNCLNSERQLCKQGALLSYQYAVTLFHTTHIQMLFINCYKTLIKLKQPRLATTTKKTFWTACH